METLGERLKRLRIAQGLGLREAARRVGISPTYLSRVENNAETSPPGEDKIRKLAEILNDDFDELMQFAGRVPKEVADVIKSDPGMPAFLRRAREENISSAELIEFLNKRKRDNK